MNVQLQLVDKIGGDVSQSERGDVMEVAGRVVRLQRVHRDLVRADAQSISNTCRQIIEDLLGRLPLTDNERIVEAVVETELNKSGVVWSSRHATWCLDDTRQTRRDTSCSRCHGSLRIGFRWLVDDAGNGRLRGKGISSCGNDCDRSL